MKFFSNLGTCFVPRGSPPALSDENYLIPIHRSDDYVSASRKRASRYRHLQSRWHPKLSVIVEDSEVRDRDNDVYRKSEKKLSGKNRSTTDIACFDEWRFKENSKPLMFVSPFSSSPFMF